MEGRWIITEEEWKVFVEKLTQGKTASEKATLIESLLVGTWREVHISPELRKKRFEDHLNHFTPAELIGQVCHLCSSSNQTRPWWQCSVCSLFYCVLHGYTVAKPLKCKTCDSKGV